MAQMGTSGSEGTVWAGPRDDGFYVDLGGIFDLANLRGKGTAQDGVAGYNVSSIAIAATVFAVINYRRANEWQDNTRAADQRATELQADLDATNAQLDLAQTELKVMSIGLDASNKDRDALQAQIDALTAEQTNAGDQPLTNQPPDGGVLATSDP